jgi:hypothetical protein
MAVVGRPAQHLEEPGPQADRRVALDLQLLGQEVRRLKADAADVAGEEIGIGQHALDRVLAIGVEDPARARRADALALEEEQDVPALALAVPDLGDASRGLGADARHLGQPLGRDLDHLAKVLAEMLDQPLGRGLAHALDGTRGEIGLDPVVAGRRQERDGRRLELPAPARIVLPVALGAHHQPGPALGRAADHRRGLGLALDPDPEHGKARRRLLEDDMLDGARKDPARGQRSTPAGVAPGRATPNRLAAPAVAG